MAEAASAFTYGKRILAADDEPHVRRILKSLLESRRHRLTAVEDGLAALALLEGDEPFDLVLLDLMMPGASGLEVLQRIKSVEHRRDLPVVILTAKGQDTDRDEAFNLGAAEFVTKPFSPKKLLALIDTLLAGS